MDGRTRRGAVHGVWKELDTTEWLWINVKCPNWMGQDLEFSCSVVSYSLRPHGLQHTRLSYPSPAPRACSNPCPMPGWWHPTTSYSVHTFCLQSVPASGYFPVSQFIASGGQSIGAAASASVLPMNIQSWLTGLISLFKGLSRVFSNNTVQKHQFVGAQPSLRLNSHIHTWLLETQSLHFLDRVW